MSPANIHSLFYIIQPDTYLPRDTFFETQYVMLSHQRVAMNGQKYIRKFLF